jgi:hypothetical protein
MSRSLVLSLALVGCTFNVQSFTRDVSSTAPSAPTHLSADFSGLASASGFGVRIDGSPTATTAAATVTVEGLVQSAANPDTVVSGVHVDWANDAANAGGLRLTMGYDGSYAETAWIEDVHLALPSATGLDLTLAGASLAVVGVDGPIHAVADSGSISIRGAGSFDVAATSGSIDVQGHTGTAQCTSGSIHVQTGGDVVLQTTSGSIDGDFGGGGSASASSGSIDLALAGALDHDLTLSATSGSISLVVPVGTSMRVQTQTGSGSSHVHVGGVDSNDDFTGTIGNGGYLVHATTTSGSISIVER